MLENLDVVGESMKRRIKSRKRTLLTMLVVECSRWLIASAWNESRMMRLTLGYHLYRKRRWPSTIFTSLREWNFFCMRRAFPRGIACKRSRCDPINSLRTTRACAPQHRRTRVFWPDVISRWNVFNLSLPRRTFSANKFDKSNPLCWRCLPSIDDVWKIAALEILYFGQVGFIRFAW